MIGFKYILRNPFYLYFKKHFCPICNCQLKIIRSEKIVNSGSEEAKNFDFSFNGDGFLIGDIKFIWKQLFCENCKKVYEIKEFRQLEKKIIQREP